MYFNSYAQIEIHDEMVGDIVRTDTFRKAIFEDVKGCVVIDVGAGTGILSLFSVEAGAKQVYAIEASDIIKVCRD